MEYPLIVFSNNSRSFLSWIINFRTKGNYNHAMFSTEKYKFITQGLTYKQISDKKYKKKGCRLKYFEIQGLNELERLALFSSIRTKLKKAWYWNCYDFAGIFGQATGLKFLNNPKSEYCSEDVVLHLKSMCKVIKKSKLKNIILKIPNQISPAELNTYLKRYPVFFKCVERWDSDADL